MLRKKRNYWIWYLLDPIKKTIKYRRRRRSRIRKIFKFGRD